MPDVQVTYEQALEAERHLGDMTDEHGFAAQQEQMQDEMDVT